MDANGVKLLGEKLIAASYEGNFKDIKNLHLAFQLNNPGVLNYQNNEGETALIVATKKRDIPIVNLLISANPNLNMKDKSGNTALMYAAKKNQTEIAEALLNAGADPKAGNQLENTALDIAKLAQNSRMIALLSNAILQNSTASLSNTHTLLSPLSSRAAPIIFSTTLQSPMSTLAPSSASFSPSPPHSQQSEENKLADPASLFRKINVA